MYVEPLPARLVTHPFVTVKSVKANPVTLSGKVTVTGIGNVEVGLDNVVLKVGIGLVVSTINALFAPRDPAIPGDGRVSVAVFPAVSVIVPERAPVET